MKRILFILVLMIGLLAMGCAAGQTEKAEENLKDSDTPKAETVEANDELEDKSFTFTFGQEEKTITAPAEAKRIVVIGYDLIDIVDSLGHKDKIVGVPDPKGPMFPKFLEGYDAITSVGSLLGDDLEAIAGLEPDLILAGARTYGAYEDLSKIAPTAYFTVPGMNSTKFEEKTIKNIQEVAYLLNAEAEAERLIGEIQDKIVKIHGKVEAIEDQSSLFLIVSGKSVNVYTDNPESRYGFVYNEFGFDTVADVEEIAVEDKKVNDGEASRHGNSISFEFISAKDPNYLIVLDRGTATASADVAATDTLDNPLIHATKAWQNGNVIYLDGVAWYLATGGIEATNIMLDELLEAVE